MIIINNEEQLKKYLSGIFVVTQDWEGQSIECNTLCIRNVTFNKNLLSKIFSMGSKRNFLFVDCVFGVGKGNVKENIIKFRKMNWIKFIRCKFSKITIWFCEEDWVKDAITTVGISFIDCKGAKGSSIEIEDNFYRVDIINSRFDAFSISLVNLINNHRINILNSRIKRLCLSGDSLIQRNRFSLGRESLHIFESKIHEMELHDCNCDKISTLGRDSITFSALTNKGVQHLVARFKNTFREERVKELSL